VPGLRPVSLSLAQHGFDTATKNRRAVIKILSSTILYSIVLSEIGFPLSAVARSKCYTISRGYNAKPHGLGIALTLEHCSSALKIGLTAAWPANTLGVPTTPSLFEARPPCSPHLLRSTDCSHVCAHISANYLCPWQLCHTAPCFATCMRLL
jgi:hypothetical protein